MVAQTKSDVWFVAQVHGVIGGFPCKSVSAAREVKIDNAIECALGVTGKVFSAINRFNKLRSGELHFEILENVKGLGAPRKDRGPSNHESVVMKTQTSMNAYSASLELDPLDLMWGVHRPRLYMLFIGFAQLVGLSKQFLDNTVQHCIDVAHACARGFRMCQLTLSNSDPDVAAYIAACRAMTPCSFNTQRPGKQKKRKHSDADGS